MKMIYQDKLTQLDKLAQHIGYEDYSALPESKRSEVHQFLGLLGEIELDFFRARMYEKKADYLNDLDQISKVEAFHKLKL